MAISSLKISNFNHVLETNPLPILVFFTASWDSHGKKLIPILNQLSSDYSGRLDIFELDTNESPEFNTQFHLRSIPSFIIFKNGNHVAQQAGGGTKAQIEQFFTPHL